MTIKQIFPMYLMLCVVSIVGAKDGDLKENLEKEAKAVRYKQVYEAKSVEKLCHWYFVEKYLGLLDANASFDEMENVVREAEMVKSGDELHEIIRRNYTFYDYGISGAYLEQLAHFPGVIVGEWKVGNMPTDDVVLSATIEGKNTARHHVLAFVADMKWKKIERSMREYQ